MPEKNQSRQRQATSYYVFPLHSHKLIRSIWKSLISNETQSSVVYRRNLEVFALLRHGNSFSSRPGRKQQQQQHGRKGRNSSFGAVKLDFCSFIMQCCLPKRQCMAGSCSSSLPTLATLEQERRTPKISKNVFHFFPIYGFSRNIIVCETRVQWVDVLKNKKVYFS